MCTVEDVMTELAEATAQIAAGIANQRAAIIKAYRAKKSLRDIAEATDLSHEGVRTILTNAGVELRDRGRPPKTDS